MKSYILSLLSVAEILHLVNGQTGVVSPLAGPCAQGLSKVVCINKYGAVMPYHFYRQASSGGLEVTYGQTSVPNDTSFAQVNGADFVVFDKTKGLALLGSSPSYEFVFSVLSTIHEAPVYVASQNKLYVSQLAPGLLPQLVVDLSANPPTLSNFSPNPPIYAPNGGTFHNGLIYFGASGGIDNIGGMEQRSGIRTVDPATNKSTSLLNNYFGNYFNTIDDLFVHPNGDVWFTDPDYAWFNKLTDTPPQLPAATYRFRPSTGATYLVEDTLIQPNGIALAPGGQTVYITDSAGENGDISATGRGGSSFNTTSHRTIYAYDLSADATYLTNKRPFYLAQDWIPDGLKVAANGYVVTGAGKGVDVLDQQGSLLVRIQTNYTVQNFAWTGPNLNTLWMVGYGGISRVQWNLTGQDLTSSST
ncbi:hypothetical protein MMC25_007128 [Agyrium rufum]|nr:hypothetical protein [Agyrium rufum]